MSIRKTIFPTLVAVLLGAVAAPAQSPNTSTSSASTKSPGLGRPISEADVKNWDIAILPNGVGLPAGHGTPQEGAKVYAEKCSACHGEQGRGGVAPFYPALVGGAPLTNGIETPKTIANYYAYATTIFDYVRRAMPYNAPRSLRDDEVYALTAYILSLNKLIGENDVMDAQTLPKVKMPNRDNFIMPYPDRI
ncbi:MAG TPA: cytochrome c [Xanthobacteraceae bacterium]|nr:cytochrome c [Xanthobacteraceae bacterium]